MRKREFISELSSRLNNMPREEKADIIEYYDELIEDTIDRTGKREEEVIDSLGSIDSIVKRVSFGASTAQDTNTHKIRYEENDDEEIIEPEKVEIVEDEPIRNNRSVRNEVRHEERIVEQPRRHEEPRHDVKRDDSSTLRIIILIITFPLWIGLLSGLFGCVIGFGCAGFGIGVGGIAALIIGLSTIATSLSEALFVMGVGAILLGVSFIITPSLIKLMVYLIKQLCKLVRWIFTGSSK